MGFLVFYGAVQSLIIGPGASSHKKEREKPHDDGGGIIVHPLGNPSDSIQKGEKLNDKQFLECNFAHLPPERPPTMIKCVCAQF